MSRSVWKSNSICTDAKIVNRSFSLFLKLLSTGRLVRRPVSVPNARALGTTFGSYSVSCKALQM